MRTWVEKLAIFSKSKGIYFYNHVDVNDLKWCLYKYTKDNGELVRFIEIRYIENKKETKTSEIKLYDDEFDLLQEAQKFVEKKTQDELIEIINNFK